MIVQVDGFREEAILVINGEVFSSSINHQCCLQEYWEKYGLKKEYFLDYDSNNIDKEEEKAIEITYKKKVSHEVLGYDIYDTDDGTYLLAFDREIFEKTLDWMKEYAKVWSAKLGYFLNNGVFMQAEIFE